MSIVMGIVGILFTVFLAWIASSNKKIAFKHWKNIILLIILQFVVTFLFLNTTGGQTAI